MSMARMMTNEWGWWWWWWRWKCITFQVAEHFSKSNLPFSVLSTPSNNFQVNGFHCCRLSDVTRRKTKWWSEKVRWKRRKEREKKNGEQKFPNLISFLPKTLQKSASSGNLPLSTEFFRWAKTIFHPTCSMGDVPRMCICLAELAPLSPTVDSPASPAQSPSSMSSDVLSIRK